MDRWRNLPRKDKEALMLFGLLTVCAIGLLGLAYFNLSPSPLAVTPTPGCLRVDPASMSEVFRQATQGVDHAATVVSNYMEGQICQISTSTPFPTPRFTPVPPVHPGTIIGF